MRKKNLHIVIISLAFLALNAAVYASTDQTTPQNIPEKIKADAPQTGTYLWQMDEYNNVKNKHPDLIMQNIQKENIPENLNDRYLWQIDKYKGVAEKKTDVIKENIKDETIPKDKDKLYNWQTDTYKNATQFHPEMFDHNIERSKQLQQLNDLIKSTPPNSEKK